LRRTYRFPIDPQFLADWDDFVKAARRHRATPAQMLQRLIVAFLDRPAAFERAMGGLPEKQSRPSQHVSTGQTKSPLKMKSRKSPAKSRVRTSQPSHSRKRSTQKDRQRLKPDDMEHDTPAPETVAPEEPELSVPPEESELSLLNENSEHPLPVEELDVDDSIFEEEELDIAYENDNTSSIEPPEPREGHRTMPKFRLLALMRTLDEGDGVTPNQLFNEAVDLGIDQPERLSQKLIRRGVIYIHEGRYKTA